MIPEYSLAELVCWLRENTVFLKDFGVHQLN